MPTDVLNGSASLTAGTFSLPNLRRLWENEAFRTRRVETLSAISEQSALFEGFSNNTPCYVYSKAAFIDNYTRLKEKLGTPLFVSIKANSDFRLLIGQHEHIIDGLEAASLPELEAALTVVRGAKIYVNNPAMNLELLTHAVRSQVNVVIDNSFQMELLATLDRTSLRSIVVRLNSSVLKKLNPQHTGGKEDHFGVDFESLPDIVQRANQLRIKISGFHMFQGSNTFFNGVSQSPPLLRELVDRLSLLLGHSFSFFNLGGGFPADWADNSDFDWATYRAGLQSIAPSLGWAHESGRGVFSSAGFFLTRVLSTKLLNQKMVAICDGGIAQNFLLCKTENPMRKYNVPLVLKKNHSHRPICDYPILYVGASCSQDDIIAKSPAQSIAPAIGDLIVFSNCGAYNNSYTMPHFLSLGAANKHFTD